MSLRTFFLLQTSLARVTTVQTFTAEDPWNRNLLSNFALEDYRVTVLDTDQPSNFSKDRLLTGFIRALHSSADGAVHFMPESMAELWETGQLPVETLPGLLKAIEPKLIGNDYRPVMHSPLIKGLAYFHAFCFAFIELLVLIGVILGPVPVLIGVPVAIGAGFLCWAVLRYWTHFGKFMRRWSQMKWLLTLYNGIQPGYSGRLWIDPASGVVQRILIVVDGTDKDLHAFRQVETLVEYAEIKIDTRSFFAPVRSLTLSESAYVAQAPFDNRATKWLNETTFTGYHRFGSDAQIITETEKPEPDRKP